MSHIKIKKIQDAYSTLEALRDRTGDKKFLATPYIITSGDIRAPDPLHHIRFDLYSSGPQYNGHLELILRESPRNHKIMESTLKSLSSNPSKTPKQLVEELLDEVSDTKSSETSHLDFYKMSDGQGLFFYRPKPMQGVLADFALVKNPFLKNPLYFAYSIVLGVNNTKKRALTTRQEFTQDLRDLFTIAKGVLDTICKGEYDINIPISA